MRERLLKEAGPGPFTGPGRSLRASGRCGDRAKAAEPAVAELVSTPPVTVSPDASVAEAAKLAHHVVSPWAGRADRTSLEPETARCRW